MAAHTVDPLEELIVLVRRLVGQGILTVADEDRLWAIVRQTEKSARRAQEIDRA